MDESAPVRIYVMGKNKWIESQDYPLAETVYTDYYLHSGGDARTLSGNGTLSTEAPGDEPADTYIYDPNDPAPDKVAGGVPGAIQDWTPVEASRKDMLIYTSDVLTEPVTVVGPCCVQLEISSDCPDTDFMCRLTDVYPNGKSLNITDGAVRASYNNTYERHLLESGVVRSITCDLGNTVNCFMPGHRIRLEVTSSCFPMIDRNHNTGNRVGTDSELRTANNTVHHDSVNASRLVLAVIPEA